MDLENEIQALPRIKDKMAKPFGLLNSVSTKGKVNPFKIGRLSVNLSNNKIK